MKRLKCAIACSLLVALMTACFGGKSFSRELRIVLLAAPPLIESLPLPPVLKSGLITDFTDIASHAAGLSECLSEGIDKPADLRCVQTFQRQVEVIVSRGNFGNANNEKVQRILSLIRGIVASAIIYYGGTPPAGVQVTGPATEDSIKRQIEELKREIETR